MKQESKIVDKQNGVLAANLALYLKDKGISKSELAREMGVTRQTVQVWLKKGSISRENLIKLSFFFNTSVSSLIGDSEDVNQDVNLLKQELKVLIEAIPPSHIIFLQYLKKMLS